MVKMQIDIGYRKPASQYLRSKSLMILPMFREIS